MNKVLILDGNTRSALAATRSLGRRGNYVIVADENRRTLAGSSRYCNETFTYPPITESPERFISTIRSECRRRRINVILPMTEMSTETALKYRHELQPASVPFGEFQAFDQLTDKWKLFKLAERLKLSMPKTYFIEHPAALKAVFPKLTFPAVLKPARSMTFENGRWNSNSVIYANSVREMEQLVFKHDCFRRHPFLIQDFIAGQSCGIFLLYDHGKPVAFFSHRRIRENPPSGGVSVLCESIQANPEALKTAQNLLDHVAWHGVAMVEFKIAAHGIPYLIEVNSRFWGSLQLAIDAGVDFPSLAYQLATGGVLAKVGTYRIGVRSRWLLGDLARLYKIVFGKGVIRSDNISRAREVLRFLNFFDTRTQFDVNRWNDLRPFLMELGKSLYHRPAKPWPVDFPHRLHQYAKN